MPLGGRVSPGEAEPSGGEIGTSAPQQTSGRYCAGVRYTLTTTSPQEVALDAAAALSASAGCAEPGISGSTECLGRADDPPLCGEDGH